MQGAVKPLTVSYSYNGRGDVDSGTITAGQSLNLSFAETSVLLPITFKCAGGSGEYTHSLTKVNVDNYTTVSQSGDTFILNTAYFDCTFVITSGSESITCNIKYNPVCLTGDTLITLADGTQKRIDELTLSDKVLSYNPSTMQLEADEITYTDSKEDESFTEYTKYIFSDNTEIKTVHRHRFYNMGRQAMTHMDEWKIGEHAIKQDGTVVELISSELIKETVKHYTIFTKNQNYFANGLLSGNRYTESMHFEAVD